MLIKYRASNYPFSPVYDKLIIVITMVFTFWPIVIELGKFKIQSQTPLQEVIWFIIGLILLAGLSAAVLWWNHRSQPDPFV